MNIRSIKVHQESVCSAARRLEVAITTGMRLPDLLKKLASGRYADIDVGGTSIRITNLSDAATQDLVVRIQEKCLADVDAAIELVESTAADMRQAFKEAIDAAAAQSAPGGVVEPDSTGGRRLPDATSGPHEREG